MLNDEEARDRSADQDDSIDGSVVSHACHACEVAARDKGRARARRRQDTKRCRFDRGQGSCRRNDL